MALFNYTAVDRTGAEKTGTIDALNVDVAIAGLQRRGLVISSIVPADKKSLLEVRITFFDRVKTKDIVILSRQITTLFEAQVSALRAFRMLSAETQSPVLREKLGEIADDLQGGSTISAALAKHPKVFSEFYVNMVKAGEESGKLDRAFSFLANYLDRNYEVASKARNALVYPAFVILTFFAVMVLMLTTVIPRLSDILLETGQDIPVYTKVVIGLSQFFSQYIVLLLFALVIFGVLVVKYIQSEAGKSAFARMRLELPYIGELYQRLFMSRISDSLSSTLHSGIQLVRGMEISAEVVGDPVYRDVMLKVAKEIQTGRSASDVMNEHKQQFPSIFVAMVKIGEETGDLSNVLETMATFYRREVAQAVDTLVSLIEPLMIVMLALGVGFLLSAVLVPIYNISAGL